MGGAHFHRLPRLADLRIAAERAGHGRSRNAEHHGDRPASSSDGPFSPDEMHKRIEAMKLAYADVRRYYGRSAHLRPCRWHGYSRRITHEARRADRSARGQLRRALAADPVGSDTTYLTVVDRDGNIASWIQSIYAQFRLRQSPWMAWGSCCRIAARDSRSIPSIRTCWRAANGRSIPSFPALWSGATSTSASASWAGPISRWRMRSLFPTSSITE